MSGEEIWTVIVSADFKYQTFWRRFWAPYIDGIVLLPLTLIEPFIIRSGLNFFTALAVVVIHFASLAYSIWMHAKFGQTVGKMVTRVKVTDLSGGKITLKQAVLRDILLVVFFVIGVVMILLNPEEYSRISIDRRSDESMEIPIWYVLVSAGAIIWWVLEILTMLTNSKRRALHDYIAGTVVIKSKFADQESKD